MLRIFDSAVVVTPEELSELTVRYLELLPPYLRRHRPDAPLGARLVSAHLRLVPSTS